MAVDAGETNDEYAFLAISGGLLTGKCHWKTIAPWICLNHVPFVILPYPVPPYHRHRGNSYEHSLYYMYMCTIILLLNLYQSLLHLKKIIHLLEKQIYCLFHMFTGVFVCACVCLCMCIYVCKFVIYWTMTLQIWRNLTTVDTNISPHTTGKITQHATTWSDTEYPLA